LKEISGENAYDRYLEVHAATHPGKPAMSRGEFYRWRQDEKYAMPAGRPAWRMRLHQSGKT
jgi:uncharacterized short protein YbdD (DUF466 family)